LGDDRAQAYTHGLDDLGLASAKFEYWREFADGDRAPGAYANANASDNIRIVWAIVNGGQGAARTSDL
jgi:hypothetical protein